MIATIPVGCRLLHFPTFHYSRPFLRLFVNWILKGLRVLVYVTFEGDWRNGFASAQQGNWSQRCSSFSRFTYTHTVLHDICRRMRSFSSLFSVSVHSLEILSRRPPRRERSKLESAIIIQNQLYRTRGVHVSTIPNEEQTKANTDQTMIWVWTRMNSKWWLILTIGDRRKTGTSKSNVVKIKEGVIWVNMTLYGKRRYIRNRLWYEQAWIKQSPSLLQ